MLSESVERQFLDRIQSALARAGEIVASNAWQNATGANRQGAIKELELALSHGLRKALLQRGEGWLCEEDADDPARLGCGVVWVVDPVDGTIELIKGLPEWSISVGLVIEGVPVAGGVYNPSTQELFLGSSNLGVTCDGKPVRPNGRVTLDQAIVLASRQEFARGEWTCFESRNFTIRPTGSVAYKLALVSAGLADATWTLSPKHEWDVAAGVALVAAAGCRIGLPGNRELQFNGKETLLPGLIASAEGIWEDVNSLLRESMPPSGGNRQRAFSASKPK